MAAGYLRGQQLPTAGCRGGNSPSRVRVGALCKCRGGGGREAGVKCGPQRGWDPVAGSSVGQEARGWQHRYRAESTGGRKLFGTRFGSDS